ncbi:MAG: Asp-tRNA(Asn)/Glu-tRNA(Gln) amidotransferase subunit GatC [Planctomycetota bacterium]
MSKIDRAEIKRVAALAKIELTDEEIGVFSEQMAKILGHFLKLAEVDTNSVDPLVYLSSDENLFREDDPVPCLSLDDALGNAALRSGPYFRVPKTR